MVFSVILGIMCLITNPTIRAIDKQRLHYLKHLYSGNCTVVEKMHILTQMKYLDERRWATILHDRLD